MRVERGAPSDSLLGAPAWAAVPALATAAQVADAVADTYYLLTRGQPLPRTALVASGAAEDDRDAVPTLPDPKVAVSTPYFLLRDVVQAVLAWRTAVPVVNGAADTAAAYAVVARALQELDPAVFHVRRATRGARTGAGLDVAVAVRARPESAVVGAFHARVRPAGVARWLRLSQDD